MVTFFARRVVLLSLIATEAICARDAFGRMKSTATIREELSMRTCDTQKSNNEHVLAWSDLTSIVMQLYLLHGGVRLNSGEYLCIFYQCYIVCYYMF